MNARSQQERSRDSNVALSQYAMFGAHNFVNVLEARDNKAIVNVSFEL
jgi:uncharacterized protein with GYD domain